MNRMLILLTLALCLGAGWASAQVAVPELVPAAPRYFLADVHGFNGATITADNPAAMQWGEPARLGFGIVDLETTPAGGGAVTEIGGYFLGYRGVSDRFSFGIEHLTVEEDTGGTFKETASSGHISFEILDGLALGAGLDLAESDTGTGSSDVESNTFGLSVAIQETFYLGYALGRDRFEDSAGNTGDRDTTLLGFAIRTDKGIRWHLAYDMLDRDDFDNTVGGGYDATTLTVQAGLGSWVLGFQQVEIKPKGGGGAFEANVIDFGWAPESGLTLTARISDGERDTGGGVQTDESTSVTIAFLF